MCRVSFETSERDDMGCGLIGAGDVYTPSAPVIFRHVPECSILSQSLRSLDCDPHRGSQGGPILSPLPIHGDTCRVQCWIAYMEMMTRQKIPGDPAITAKSTDPLLALPQNAAHSLQHIFVQSYRQHRQHCTAARSCSQSESLDPALAHRIGASRSFPAAESNFGAKPSNQPISMLSRNLAALPRSLPRYTVRGSFKSMPMRRLISRRPPSCS